MPLMFGELIQEVINEVRAKEEAFAVAKQLSEQLKERDAKIKALEGEVESLKKAAADKLDVREPDKKPVLEPMPTKALGLREVK